MLKLNLPKKVQFKNIFVIYAVVAITKRKKC